MQNVFNTVQVYLPQFKGVVPSQLEVGLPASPQCHLRTGADGVLPSFTRFLSSSPSQRKQYGGLFTGDFYGPSLEMAQMTSVHTQLART